MATISELVGRKSLEPMNVRLVGRQQPLRQMHVTAGFKAWAQSDLKKIPPTQWGGHVPVVDQVIDLLRQYRSGANLHFSRQFNFLRPVGSGVWELKTGDVRIFGWFVAIDSFIGSTGEDANYLKENSAPRYEKCVLHCIREREEIDLDAPKFIASTDPKDVISS